MWCLMTRKEFFERVATELIKKKDATMNASRVSQIPVYSLVADALGLEEPKTKVVYEWIYLTISGSWFLASCIITEEEASNTFKQGEYKKTGRSWEVPE